MYLLDGVDVWLPIAFGSRLELEGFELHTGSVVRPAKLLRVRAAGVPRGDRRIARIVPDGHEGLGRDPGLEDGAPAVEDACSPEGENESYRSINQAYLAQKPVLFHG